MNTELEKEICKQAVFNYGKENQKDMLIEECSELIIALQNYIGGFKDNVTEEIADVEIMCQQMDFIYDPEKIKTCRCSKVYLSKESCLGYSIRVLAKLIQAVSKNKRDNNKTPEREIAIVLDTIEELRIIFNDQEIDMYKDQKLQRLKSRIEKCQRRIHHE